MVVSQKKRAKVNFFAGLMFLYYLCSENIEVKRFI